MEQSQHNHYIVISFHCEKWCSYTQTTNNIDVWELEQCGHGWTLKAHNDTTHTHTHTLTTIKQECHKTGTRCEETGTYHLAVWDWHQRSLGDQGQWWPAWCDQHALSEPTGGLLATCWMWTMRPTPPLLHWAHLEKTGSHVCKALPAPWLDRELAQSRKASLVKVWKRGKHKQ